MVSHLIAERASRLGLILTPVRSPEGVDQIRIRRGTAELAIVASGEIGPWLAAAEAQRRQSSATDSR